LERTAMVSHGPSVAGGSGFPYIEAGHGRINFKFGAETKQFALTDATYAFWQGSENRWGMSLKGQPMRTDFSLGHTGQVAFNGNWTRGAAVFQTPVRFSARWEEAQLGQLSKALTGEDRGWRGTVNLSVNGVGTPANLVLRGDV